MLLRHHLLARRIAMTAAALLGVVLAGGSLFVAAERAQAAVGVDTQGISFEVDDANPDAGATVVGFDGDASVVEIPAEVEIAGTMHPVMRIGDGAFEAAGLTEVTIPDSVIVVGDTAFMGNRLTEVTIPDSVVSIGADAFFDNLLRKVTLGSSVDSLGEGAFEHTDWDHDFEILAMDVFFSGPPPATFSPGLPTTFSGSFADVEGVVVHFPSKYDERDFAGGYTTPTWQGYPTRVLGAVDFELNFSGAGVSSQWIPIGDTFTAPPPPARTGWTFSGWFTDSDLATPFDPDVPIVADLTLYAGWDPLSTTIAIEHDGLTYLVDPANQSAGASVVAFDGSRAVLSIPAEVEDEGIVYRVTSIGDNAFDDAGLTEVTIPDSVTSIGEYAFTSYYLTPGVNTLSHLVIPDSVVTIGAYAFYANEIETLTLGTGLTTIGEGAFLDNLLTGISLPDSVTGIEGHAFSGNPFREVVIPDSVVTIGEWAFYDNELLERVVLGAALTTIGDGAFAHASLTGIVIPDSVTRVGEYAFGSNPLARVMLGAAVTSIGDYAFDHYDGDNDEFLPMDVYFSGPPPVTFQAVDADLGSFADPAGVIVHYPLAYDEDSIAGGYTGPRWQGYAAYAVVVASFEVNGADDPIAPMAVIYGDPVTRPADPTRTGWAFTGWYTDSTLATPFDFSAPTTADVTLAAGWKLAPTSPAAAGDALPTTGAPESMPFVLAATAAIAAGMLLVGFGRSRRAGRSRSAEGGSGRSGRP